MSKILIFLSIFYIHTYLSALTKSVTECGARAFSLGGAYLALTKGAESVFWNPSRLFSDNRLEVMIDYSKPYTLERWNEVSLGLIRNYENFSLGMGIKNKFLGSVYMENSIIIGIGNLLPYNLKLGGNIKFLSFKVFEKIAGKDLKRKWYLLFDWGLSYQVYDYLTVGYTRIGILSPKISIVGEDSQRQKSPHHFGLSLNYPQDVNWVFQFDDYKKITPQTIRYGVEVWFGNSFSGRIGVYNARLALGFGISTFYLDFDFLSLMHETLGDTYGITIKIKQ